MEALYGNKSTVVYDTSTPDLVTGGASSEHDFVIRFNYDCKENTGIFDIYPIVHIDGIQYILQISVGGAQSILDSPDYKDFVLLISNIVDAVEIYKENDRINTIYWNLTEFGFKIEYDQNDIEKVKITILNNDITIFIDLKERVQKSNTDKTPVFSVEIKCVYEDKEDIAKVDLVTIISINDISSLF